MSCVRDTILRVCCKQCTYIHAKMVHCCEHGHTNCRCNLTSQTSKVLVIHYCIQKHGTMFYIVQKYENNKLLYSSL
jgi:hypothetical protein